MIRQVEMEKAYLPGFLKISSRSLYRRFSRKKSPTFVFLSSLKEKNAIPYTHTSRQRKVSSPKT